MTNAAVREEAEPNYCVVSASSRHRKVGRKLSTIAKVASLVAIVIGGYFDAGDYDP
jgi:hypothetical protein